MILDGEVVITDEKGRTNFQSLQNHLKSLKGKKPSYVIFDLLALDGKDLRMKPLIERKTLLESLFKDAPKELFYSKHVRGKGRESYLAACRFDFEGIIGKKIDSVYSGTRNGDWIKLKYRKRQEFVIGGYSLSDKRTEGVSSLLLGVYEGKDLIYSGRAGTGFTERSRLELGAKFNKIKRDASPFKHATRPESNERLIWLEPVMVAEVEFAEWTNDNLIRQASFKGLRIDKDSKEVVFEVPSRIPR